MIDSEGTSRLCTRLYVSEVDKLRKEIIEETHFLLTVFIQVLPKCIVAEDYVGRATRPVSRFCN